jgi:teichuronic acid exporter
MTSNRKLLISGIFYTALSKYSNILITILFTSVLARLLTPEEYGVIAIVMVFITFFQLLSNFGIGPAIIQNKRLTDNDLKSIFTFSIILGFVFAFIFYFSSSLISHFYKREELKVIVKLLSLSVLFYSFNVVPQSLNYKKLLFKKVGLIAIVIQLITGSIAVFFAAHGFSYYSLVIKYILDGLFIFIGNYYFSPIKLSVKIEISAISKIAKFASFQFFFNFINYFSRNADNLLIGKYINIKALGYYDKAYQLMMMPVVNLTHVITPVLQPILSEFENDKQRIYNAYLKLVKILATIGFPLSIFLFFSASEIIQILLGSQWVESIKIFKILALTVGIQIVFSSSGTIFQATNRTDLLFISGFINAIFMISAILFGIFIGKSLESIGYGLIVSFTINFFQTFYILINRALHSSFIDFLKVFIYPLFISAGIAISLWIISKYTIISPIYSLTIKLFVTGVVFILLFLYSSENRELLKRNLRGYFN